MPTSVNAPVAVLMMLPEFRAMPTLLFPDPLPPVPFSVIAPPEPVIEPDEILIPKLLPPELALPVPVTEICPVPVAVMPLVVAT